MALLLDTCMQNRRRSALEIVKYKQILNSQSVNSYGQQWIVPTNSSSDRPSLRVLIYYIRDGHCRDHLEGEGDITCQAIKKLKSHLCQCGKQTTIKPPPSITFPGFRGDVPNSRVSLRMTRRARCLQSCANKVQGVNTRRTNASRDASKRE